MILELRLNRVYKRGVDRALRRLAPEVVEEPVGLREIAKPPEIVALLDSPKASRVLHAIHARQKKFGTSAVA